MCKTRASKCAVFVLFIGMNLLAAASLGYGQDVKQLAPQSNQLRHRAADAQPISVDWINAPGKLDQVAVGDFNCDGVRDELVGVTESNEIYYSGDFLNWSLVPGILGQITTGDFDGNGCDDLAGVTDSGDIYFSLDMENWTNVPGKLSQVMAGDFNHDGIDELVGVTKSGQVYYLLDDLVE